MSGFPGGLPAVGAGEPVARVGPDEAGDDGNGLPSGGGAFGFPAEPEVSPEAEKPSPVAALASTTTNASVATTLARDSDLRLENLNALLNAQFE